MTSQNDVVVLFDMDNTLLDNDRVMVDDKLRILAAMKNIWGERLTTVFPRQGHYALDPQNIAAYPAADLTLEHIGELVTRPAGDARLCRSERCATVISNGV